MTKTQKKIEDHLQIPKADRDIHWFSVYASLLITHRVELSIQKRADALQMGVDNYIRTYKGYE